MKAIYQISMGVMYLYISKQGLEFLYQATHEQEKGGRGIKSARLLNRPVLSILQTNNVKQALPYCTCVFNIKTLKGCDNMSYHFSRFLYAPSHLNLKICTRDTSARADTKTPSTVIAP
jgi:hypothetical protein